MNDYRAYKTPQVHPFHGGSLGMCVSFLKDTWAQTLDVVRKMLDHVPARAVRQCLGPVCIL